MSIAREELTKNQRTVLDALEAADQPQSAYALLEALREEGFKAPPQIYRALDKLVESGLVHRLDSLNAFVACCHGMHGAHALAAFTICNDCGQVVEVSTDRLETEIAALADANRFDLIGAKIELRGLCENCRQ